TTSSGGGPSVSSWLRRTNWILPTPSASSFTIQPKLPAVPATYAATSGVTSHSRNTSFVVPVGTVSVGAATKSAPALVHKVVPFRLRQVTPVSVQLAVTR